MFKKGFTIAGIIMLSISIFLGICFFMLIKLLGLVMIDIFGGSLFPKNYSKKQVKQFITEFAPDATYITSITRKKENLPKNNYYLCEDSYGREFVIKSTSLERASFYSPKLFNGYECCILQKNIDEIKAVLNDTGLKHRIIGCASKMQDDNMLKWAAETPSLAPMDICFDYVKEEDMMLVANAMEKVDGILKYNYNKHCASLLKFETYDSDNVFIYFQNLKSRSMASFKLSTCESERWTANSIMNVFRNNLNKIED